ncbi:MAG: AAC(3) family N-acetyltransferase [Promethearchaeota archaeon]
MTSLSRIEVTKAQIIEDLKRIGLRNGDHVAVTLSFKSIGHVNGGPDAFIDALLETVGSDGTIMMNTFTPIYSRDLPSDYVFDHAKTAPYTGLIPRTILKRKDVFRSMHPTFSVASIGKMARYLTVSHDETANPFLPYEKLAKIGGKYLSIGIGDRLVAIRHEAQRRAGLYIVPNYFCVKFRNSEGESKIFIGLVPPCVKKLPELVPKLESMGIIKRGKIGMARSIIGSAKKLIDSMTTLLKENPTLNLCDDLFCYKCRELERRMNLYGRIINPKLFQINPLIRIVLSWRNNLLLRRLNSCNSRKTPKWIAKILRITVNIRRVVFNESA